jgi:hypothetical protein
LQYWGRSNTHQHWFAIGLRFGQKFFNVAFCSYLHLQYFNWAAVPGRRISNPPTSQSPIVGGKRKAKPYKFSTMPDKSEKERRKLIMDDLKQKADHEFESSLPTSRENFKKLFDYLDTQLGDKDCDDTNGMTKIFLVQTNIENVDEVLEWLREHSGYCDCEILANVEEQFE